jgi:Cu2+-exporting ATPase
MFTFLLLLARFIEKRVRYRDALAWQDAEQTSCPMPVRRPQDGRWVRQHGATSQAGDRVLLRAGDTVPIDGEVVRRATAPCARTASAAKPATARCEPATRCSPAR